MHLRPLLLATTLAAGLATATPALADTPVALCVPSGANLAVTTPQPDGSCPAGKARTALATQADLDAAKARVAALETRLAGVTRTTLNGAPTIRFSGVNVQVVNGAGATTALNGRGNLIVGYDEYAGARGGSHNVLLGRGHTAASWGSLIGGQNNASRGPLQVLFGDRNAATGTLAGVLGGEHNQASGRLATVSGGLLNTAEGASASIAGGASNTARGQYTHVSGGVNNVAHGYASSVLGGGGAVLGEDAAYAHFP